MSGVWVNGGYVAVTAGDDCKDIKIKQLEAKNSKLRECVEFYSNWRSYKFYGRSDEMNTLNEDAEFCKYQENDGDWFEAYIGGKRARECLRELSKDER